MRSAGVVAKSKCFPAYSYHPSRDPLHDPAALLSQEGSLIILTSNGPLHTFILIGDRMA